MYYRQLIQESASLQDIVTVWRKKLSSKMQSSSPCPLGAARDSAVTAVTPQLAKRTQHMAQMTTVLTAEKARATEGQRKIHKAFF